MNFQVLIPNLAELQEAMVNYASIATPIVQNAIVATQAILNKFTVPGIVPVKTSYLLQHWGWEVGQLQGRYYPQASYAPYVEFGTAPHLIKAVNKRVLANVETGQIFGPVVHHPGTKPNPFMERILAAAQPEITALFETALSNITTAIAAQGNG
jgi:hypothetical protein